MTDMKKMVGFLLLCSLTSYAQDKRPFYCTTFISYNRAYLNIQADVDVPEKFPTSELTIGVCLIQPLSKHFELRSRIGYGKKFKRTHENFPSQQMSDQEENQEESIVREIYGALNKELATKTTDYVDAPIILHYKIPRINVGIEFGFNYRIYGWFDDLPLASSDFATLGSLTYTFKKFTIFCSYTLGLGKILDKPLIAGNLNNSSTFDRRWNAKSSAVQVGIEYDLFKKIREKGI